MTGLAVPSGYVLQPPPATGDQPPPATIAVPEGYTLVDPAVAARAATVAAAPDYGALTASTNAMGNALSFNLMDEAVAHAAAAIDPLADWFRSKPVGGTYDERVTRHLENQRVMDAAAEAQHPTASTVGRVGAIAAVAPRAIAGLAAPVLRAATASERIANAAIGSAKGAVGGAGYGFLSGYGAGEGGIVPRVESGVAAAPSGALVGAALGAPLGAFAKVPVAAPPPLGAVGAAAQRAGVYVPRGIASDSHVIQQLGGAAKSIPYFGTKITDAGARTAAEFAAAKQGIAEGYGGGAAANAASAGQSAKSALENWVGPLTKGLVTDKYDAVGALVDPAIQTPLNETARTAAQIVSRNQASKLPPGNAVQFVRAAVSDPAGLNYEGIKNLRTHIGEMLDTPSLIPAGTKQSELKQIYGSLTQDLRTAVVNAGGTPARIAFDKANLFNARVAQRRTEVMHVLGMNPNNPASAEDVFAAVSRMAGSKSTADIAMLDKLRRTMPPGAWDQVASGVVNELGRSDALGTVSLDKFFTGYNQLSQAGKQALFGHRPDLSSALDDLATIAGRSKEVAKWANPSGTAGHAALGAAAYGLLTNPVATVGSIVGGGYMTHLLTKPATVRAMTGWVRVWDQVNRGIRLGGGQASLPQKSIEFASRRFAAEIGRELGLGPGPVNALAGKLAAVGVPGSPGNATADLSQDQNGQKQ